MEKKLTDTTIHELDIAIYNALPEGYDTTVVSGVSLNDTIKVSHDTNRLAMYISWDETTDGVLNATVYNEGIMRDGFVQDFEIVEEGIYWDTNEANVTAESIAEDIIKHI